MKKIAPALAAGNSVVRQCDSDRFDESFAEIAFALYSDSQTFGGAFFELEASHSINVLNCGHIVCPFDRDPVC